MPISARVLLVVFFGFGAAHADVTYTYTGPDFTQTTGTGGPTTSDFITLSFVLPYALPGDDGYDGPPPLSWTMSDGVNTVFSKSGGVSPDGDALDMSFSTDALGIPDYWDFQGLTSSFSVWLVTDNPDSVCCPGPSDYSTTYFGPYGRYSPPTSTANTQSIFTGAGIVGTWVVTEVPEPAKLSLFLLVLAACGAFVRNRFMGRTATRSPNEP
jgi:hypothetical protein